jgi:hypothetical protein
MAYCEPIETSLPAGGVTFLQLKQYLESREGEHLAADNDDYEDMDSNDSLGDYDEIFVNVDESRAASDAYFDIDNKNIETQLNNSRSCYESMSNNEFRSYQILLDLLDTDAVARRQQGQPQSIDDNKINRDSASPLYDSHDRDSGLLPTVPESLYNSHQPADTTINPTSPVYRTQDDVTAHSLNSLSGEAEESPPPLPRPRDRVLSTNTDTIDATQHTPPLAR